MTTVVFAPSPKSTRNGIGAAAGFGAGALPVLSEAPANIEVAKHTRDASRMNLTGTLGIREMNISGLLLSLGLGTVSTRSNSWSRVTELSGKNGASYRGKRY